MKLLVALLAVVMSAVAVMILMLGELVAMLADLVARLAPLMVLGAIVWLVMRYRARPHPQGMGAPAVMPVVAGPTLAATPAPTSVRAESAGPAVPLPPKMPHYERFYLVRGDDTGLQSPRTDGYVKVAARNLPTAPPQPARRKPQVPRIKRVSARRRTGTPRTRP